MKQVRTPRLLAFSAGLLAVSIAFLTGPGCSSVPKKPYVYGTEYGIESPTILKLRPGEEQFSFSEPNAFLDASGWWNPLSLFAKFILWDIDVDSHKFSEPTINIVREYLDDNGLQNVRVRFNENDVGDEWSRLARNDDVPSGFRWTLGLLACVGYTINPGRVFGGDHYNPYTNTISLYSDDPAIALHEASHAKDFNSREPRLWRGVYAAIYALPGVALYHEAKASSDAIGWLRAKGYLKEEMDGYKILYPAYSTYVGGNISQFVDLFGVSEAVLYAAQYGPILPAHIIGRIKAWRQGVNARREGRDIPQAPRTETPRAEVMPATNLEDPVGF